MTEISQYNKIAARIANLDDYPMTDVSDTSQSINGTTRRATHGQVLADMYAAQGRLTLESGVPISTTDQTAKTTLYYTPYVGDCIALADANGLFENYTFAELSISLAGKTASKPHDVFIYNNSGTPVLELLEWSSDTVRTTSLARTNGVLVKLGDNTRRYLGTIRTTSTTGKCEDSVTKRFVWNYYHRIPRTLYYADATSHNYTTGAWRQWNASAAAKVEIVIGYAEELLIESGFLNVIWGGAVGAYIGWGVDTTSSVFNYAQNDSANSYGRDMIVFYPLAGAGYHYIAILELGVTSATQTSFTLFASSKM
jgi:hypothetical protein